MLAFPPSSNLTVRRLFISPFFIECVICQKIAMKKTLLMIALCSIVWQTFSQARTTSKDLYNDDNGRYADSMQAKKGNNATKQNEIELSRDSLRQFFGTYAFAAQFHMNIFSVNGKAFAQRVGDGEKFQIFSKTYNVFI
jgi:hypothetical protein